MKVRDRFRNGAAAGPLQAPAGRKALAAVAALLLLLVALAAAWRWTPLGEWIDLRTLSDFLHEGPYTPLAVAAAYLLAAAVMFPVTLLNVAVVIVFGAFLGPTYALGGATLSAAAGYWAGHRLGGGTVRRFAGRRIDRISRRLARRGVLAMSVVRLVPIAPFTVVNLVAGASHISFRDFICGTLIGLAPGITATTLVVNRAAAVLRDPGMITGALLGLVAVAVVAGAWVLHRNLARE